MTEKASVDNKKTKGKKPDAPAKLTPSQELLINPENIKLIGLCNGEKLITAVVKPLDVALQIYRPTILGFLVNEKTKKETAFLNYYILECHLNENILLYMNNVSWITNPIKALKDAYIERYLSVTPEELAKTIDLQTRTVKEELSQPLNARDRKKRLH